MPQCPKCQSDMVLREGKYGEFWGCSNYPKCKGIVNVTKKSRPQKVTKINTTKKELKKIEVPSSYQKEIFKSIQELLINGKASDKQHLIINATAGSGKTATTEHCIVNVTESDDNLEVIYMVFNKKVEIEATEKGLPAKTTHSKYYSDYRNWRQTKVFVDDKKVRKIVNNLITETYEEEKFLVSVVCNLVSKVKNTCTPTDEETLVKLCDRFQIEVNGSQDRIFELAKLAIEENNKTLDTIDLDDMLYLTWKLKVPVKQYDWVFIDESQDFNRVQIELVKRTVKENGHIVIIGDPNQSIYSFRGADTRAMKNLQEAFQAKEMPLSISYRNPKSHVRLVNSVFPNIKHESFEKAKEGKIESISSNMMLGQVKDGDLVLCRTNAPLVKPVFCLIRRGVKAIILGRNIGDNLINLVEKFKTEKVDNLIEELFKYQEKEIAKLLKAGKNNHAQALEDKIETILAVSDDCTYTYEIIKRIEEIFSDNKEGVVFSTVHQAKGSESERVFILQPQLMPHKMAKTVEDLEQERNIIFVALTRSKNELYFVDGPPIGSISQEDEEQEDKDLVISQMKERGYLPEGTKLYKNVEFGINENAKVEVISEKTLEVPNCPF